MFQAIFQLASIFLTTVFIMAMVTFLPFLLPAHSVSGNHVYSLPLIERGTLTGWNTCITETSYHACDISAAVLQPADGLKITRISLNAEHCLALKNRGQQIVSATLTNTSKNKIFTSAHVSHENLRNIKLVTYRLNKQHLFLKPGEAKPVCLFNIKLPEQNRPEFNVKNDLNLFILNKNARGLNIETGA